MMEYCHVLQLIFMLKKEKKGKGKKEFQLTTQYLNIINMRKVNN